MKFQSVSWWLSSYDECVSFMYDCFLSFQFLALRQLKPSASIGNIYSIPRLLYSSDAPKGKTSLYMLSGHVSLQSDTHGLDVYLSDGKPSGPEHRPGGGKGRKGGRTDWKSRLLQVNLHRLFLNMKQLASRMNELCVMYVQCDVILALDFVI